MLTAWCRGLEFLGVFVGNMSKASQDLPPGKSVGDYENEV